MENAIEKHQHTLPPSAQEREPVTLSSDPNQAMQEMMATIDRLRAYLIEENKVLHDADTPGFMAMQDNKIEIARDYLDGMTQLLSRKDEIKNADPTLKKRLEKKRGEFAEIAHENHAAIERMRSGIQRLGERIMETAREAAKKEEQIVYGSTGQMQSGLKATMGVNESA